MSLAVHDSNESFDFQVKYFAYKTGWSYDTYLIDIQNKPLPN